MSVLKYSAPLLAACSLQKARDPEARQQLQTQLARVEQQIKEEQTRRQQQTALRSHKVGHLTHLHVSPCTLK